MLRPMRWKRIFVNTPLTTIVSRASSNIRHPTKTRVKMKFREIAFKSWQLVLQFCPKHFNITAVLLWKISERLECWPVPRAFRPEHRPKRPRSQTSALLGFLCWEFTGCPRWIPHTKTSDAEYWCVLWSASWINGWVNNGEAGDLRRHRAHYDVIVMTWCCRATVQQRRLCYLSLVCVCVCVWGVCVCGGGGGGGRQNDNFQCSQWWKCHQNEDISVSVLA